MKKLDSNKLTAEQQQFFKDHLAYLATVSKDGEPQVGPKASMRVLDESSLVYLEKTHAHAWENMKNGSKVAVVVADVPTHTNVRVLGTVEFHEDDELAKNEKAAGNAPQADVVVIKIDEIFA